MVLCEAEAGWRGERVGDCWDSASFEEEHREELRAFDKNGIRFVFLLVGVPDKNLVSIPVGFEGLG